MGYEKRGGQKKEVCEREGCEGGMERRVKECEVKRREKRVKECKVRRRRERRVKECEVRRRKERRVKGV